MKLLQVPATISKVQTMSNRALRVVVDTQENILPEVLNQLIDNYEKIGWFCFLAGEREIKLEDVKDLPVLPDESEQKTPSQKLRAVLYVKWEQQSAEYKKKYPFEVYYRGQMEKIIDKIKESLN